MKLRLLCLILSGLTLSCSREELPAEDYALLQAGFWNQIYVSNPSDSETFERLCLLRLSDLLLFIDEEPEEGSDRQLLRKFLAKYPRKMVQNTLEDYLDGVDKINSENCVLMKGNNYIFMCPPGSKLIKADIKGEKE